MVAESNGLNLCLGVNSHTQRSPPHTRSHAQHRETDTTTTELPEDNFKVGLDVSGRTDPKQKALSEAFILGGGKREKRNGCLSVWQPDIQKKTLFFGEGAPRRRRNRELNAARGGGGGREELSSRSGTLETTSFFLRDKRVFTLTYVLLLRKRTVADRATGLIINPGDSLLLLSRPVLFPVHFLGTDVRVTAATLPERHPSGDNLEKKHKKALKHLKTVHIVSFQKEVRVHKQPKRKSYRERKCEN